ncbi:MAG: sulfurtransferase TusA family protein [Gammaproteobacteria bacterium]|nr:sulfurtransferase TusA family protein [Gammaproteobacteria bacterium]
MAANTQSQSGLKLQPQITLDLNGLASPGPLPSLRRAMSSMENAHVLLLLSDFPDIESDLHLWAAQTNNQILHIDKTRPKGFGFYIQKGDAWVVTQTVDVRGYPCPTPVLKASKALAQVKPGQNIKLLSDCTAAPAEINTWIKTAGHKLLGMTEDVCGIYRFYIKK